MFLSKQFTRIRHGLRDDAPDFLRRFDEMAVGEMRISRRCAVPSVSEQIPGDWQVLAVDDGMTGHCMAQDVEPQTAEVRIRAHHPPAFA